MWTQRAGCRPWPACFEMLHTLQLLTAFAYPCGDVRRASTPQVRKPLVRAQVACMSRAGCEPGYKKTNQDNCFAFEKYITEDQALFGAMDGHGPNGEGGGENRLSQGIRERVVASPLKGLKGPRAVTCRVLFLSA